MPRASLSGLAAVALVVAAASPATAHSAGNAAAGLRSEVVSSPHGVDVAVARDGSSIMLTTSRSVVVRGYSGEPFLRYDAGRVSENLNSLTTYSAYNGMAPTMPRSAGRGPVRWRTVVTSTAYSWPDERVLWRGSRLPATVQQAPDRRHVVDRWRLALVVDGRPAAVIGQVVWVGSAESVGLTVAVVCGATGLLLVTAVMAAYPGLWRRRGPGRPV